MLPFAERWKESETIIRNKIKQAQKDKYIYALTAESTFNIHDMKVVSGDLVEERVKKKEGRIKGGQWARKMR